MSWKAFSLLLSSSKHELHLKLVVLQIGQEYQLGRFLVKPFKTYHTVPSQVRTAPPVIDSFDSAYPFVCSILIFCCLF